ncbi:MAG: hypothetical protein WAK01_05940 [Methylocystis sp.]
MRRYFLPLGVTLALAAIVGLVGFLFFRDPVTAAADDFFKTLAQEGGQAAIAKSHTQFQSTVTPQALAEISDRFGLKKYQKGEWSSRSVNGDRAELEGELSLDPTLALPAKLVLLKDDQGSWRVSFVYIHAPKASTPPPK